MKRTIILLSAIILLAACSHFHTRDVVSNKELLKGDWVYLSQDTATGAARDNGPAKLIYTFEDSLCSLEYPFDDFITYTLHDDSIITAKRNYKIEKLTTDSLVLQTPASPDETFTTGIIRLAKVKTKNEFMPSKIYFASSVCFGTCPSMLLEIDSSGRFVFLGKNYTNPEGGFRGQLDSTQFRVIINKIRNLPVSLERKYDAGWTDDQNCGVAILTKDKRIVSSAYGFDKEPIELRILFHKLMQVYKTVALTPDSSINEAYFLVRLDGLDIANHFPPPPMGQ